MLRFEACDDFGRPGGAAGGSKDEAAPGVLGAVSVSGGGARLERTRMTVLFGGDTLRSIADAERAGGASPRFEPAESVDLDLPGEAVWALDGGGGGAGVSGSDGAFLLTQRFKSLS